MRKGVPDPGPELNWEPSEIDFENMAHPDPDLAVDDGYEPDAETIAEMRRRDARLEDARVVRELTKLRARLRPVALARCPSGDGRILFGVYPFEGQLWLWQEGRRRAPNRFDWPEDPLEWEAVAEGVIDAGEAEEIRGRWLDAVDDLDYPIGPPQPPDDVFDPAPPTAQAIGSPDALDGSRLASIMHPIATCPTCKSDYTPGSVAVVVDLARRSMGLKRPGAISVTRINSVYEIPLPPGHRLVWQITQTPNHAWVLTTDAPEVPTPREQLRARLAGLRRQEEEARYRREHGDEEDWAIQQRELDAE